MSTLHQLQTDIYIYSTTTYRSRLIYSKCMKIHHILLPKITVGNLGYYFDYNSVSR